MIDVIIPAYNAHSTIEKTLASIIIQTIKNKVKVFIVDDCSLRDYDDIYEKFKNDIDLKILKLKKNSGPGVARQYGLDNSNSEYVTFLDADDLLYDVFSLENLYKYTKENNYDLVSGKEVEESGNNFLLGNNYGNLHGKLYKRKYLEKHKISFNDTYSSEDNSFNQLVLLTLPKLKLIEEKVYVYKNNVNSITRKDKDYSFDSLKWYSYNMEWVVNEAKKRNCNNRIISEFVIFSIGYIYCNYCDFYDRKDSYKIIEWSKNLFDYYIEYEKFLDDFNKYRIINSNFKVTPKISFDEFKNKFKN